jgi:hypothetical protein
LAGAFVWIAAICRIGARIPVPMQYRLSMSRDQHTAPIIVVFVIAVTAAINHCSNNKFREG